MASDVHIFPYDIQRLIVAVTAAARDPFLHFLRLLPLSVISQGVGRYPHEIEDIAVRPDEGTVRLFLSVFPEKTAQPVGDIVAQPCAPNCPWVWRRHMAKRPMSNSTPSKS